LACFVNESKWEDRNVKVLIADGDPSLIRQGEVLLPKWGYEIVGARTGHEALAVLEADDPPRIALLDWQLHGVDGIEICRRVRVRPESPSVHIVLLIPTQKENLTEGLNAGADDFLRKPVDAHELKARLRTGSRLLELEESVRVSQAALRVQVTRDPLTGAWNRSAILDFLSRDFARAARESAPLAVVLADLDRLRDINDRYGQSAGDEVLKEAVRRMRSSIRAYDAVGRYGGEEFLVVLPGSDGLTALYVAERIREKVANTAVDTVEAQIPVTVSIGVAAFTSERSDPVELLRSAGVALAHAKSSGLNRCALAAEGNMTIETGPSA
jgi:two-component system cell cycle response regulator